MQFLRWSDGPKQFGCVYHKRAIHRLAGEDVVVDIFVMPAIKDDRPIAMTIGRYRNYKPVVPKQKLGIDDPTARAGRIEEVSSLFERVGLDAELSAYLGDEVDQFLAVEAATLSAAVAAQP